MSTICMIYHPNDDGTRRTPKFPAADQHPLAVRYPFDHPTKGLLNVDAIGGEPTLSEIDALLSDAPATGEINAKATAQRTRVDAIEEIERQMTLGAPAEETLKAVLTLLKE